MQKVRRKTLSSRPVKVKIDKKLLEWTEKFIERYRPALEALAKK